MFQRVLRTQKFTCLSALLLIAGLLIPFSVDAASSPQIVGDADGNGIFNAQDADFVEATLDAEVEIPEQPYRLADVAHPCDGVIDSQDLFQLKRAADRPRGSDPISSECHGADIGTTFEGLVLDPPVIPTIDDHFRQIAQQIPEFGGFYFDENETPTVVLTDTDSRILENALDLLAEHFGEDRLGEREAAVAVRGDFSFERLAIFRDLSHSILAHEAVIAVDIDEKQNRLWIGIDDLSRRDEVLDRVVGGYGVNPDAVIVEETAQWQLQHEVNQNRIRPMQAGLQIARRLNPGFFGVCTSGPVANFSGVRGFFTNRHCTEIWGGLDGNRFYQPLPMNSSNPFIAALQDRVGTEMADPANFTFVDNSDCPEGIEGYPYKCRFSDASFIAIGADLSPLGINQVPSTKGGIFTSHHSYPYTNYRWIDQGIQYPFDGETVHMMGRSSGQSLRKVDKTCFTTDIGDFDPEGYFYALLCQYRAHTNASNGNTINGDSGAPVFKTKSLVNAALVGIHWGGSNQGHSFFSPLGGMLTDFGDFDFFFGNDPPTVAITSPAHGATVGSGTWVPVQLKANFWDPDHGGDCFGCKVEWHSSMDGFLGTSQVSGGKATLQGQLNGPGTRTITATAFDTHGETATDQIDVSLGNFAPSVEIDWPSGGTQLWLNATYQFQGHGYDNDLPGPLPCSSLDWTSSLSGDPQATGCVALLSFSSLGSRTITLTGTDASNTASTHQITVNVIDPPTNAAPQAEITLPWSGDMLPLSQSAQVSGFGNDPDDSPSLTYEWVVIGSKLIGGVGEVVIHTTVAGDEETKSFTWNPANHVINNCGGVPVQLELRVTDGDNMIGTHQIPIMVAGPVC